MRYLAILAMVGLLAIPMTAEACHTAVACCEAPTAAVYVPVMRPVVYVAPVPTVTRTVRLWRLTPVDVQVSRPVLFPRLHLCH